MEMEMDMEMPVTVRRISFTPYSFFFFCHGLCGRWFARAKNRRGKVIYGLVLSVGEFPGRVPWEGIFDEFGPLDGWEVGSGPGVAWTSLG